MMDDSALAVANSYFEREYPAITSPILSNFPSGPNCIPFCCGRGYCCHMVRRRFLARGTMALDVSLCGARLSTMVYARIKGLRRVPVSYCMDGLDIHSSPVLKLSLSIPCSSIMWPVFCSYLLPALRRFDHRARGEGQALTVGEGNNKAITERSSAWTAILISERVDRLFHVRQSIATMMEKARCWE